MIEVTKHLNCSNSLKLTIQLSCSIATVQCSCDQLAIQLQLQNNDTNIIQTLYTNEIHELQYRHGLSDYSIELVDDSFNNFIASWAFGYDNVFSVKYFQTPRLMPWLVPLCKGNTIIIIMSWLELSDSVTTYHHHNVDIMIIIVSLQYQSMHWDRTLVSWANHNIVIADYQHCDYNYRIAGNFRGRKLSRLSLHGRFHELNFKDLLDCHRILYYNKISRN